MGNARKILYEGHEGAMKYNDDNNVKYNSGLFYTLYTNQWEIEIVKIRKQDFCYFRVKQELYCFSFLKPGCWKYNGNDQWTKLTTAQLTACMENIEPTVTGKSGYVKQLPYHKSTGSRAINI